MGRAALYWAPKGMTCHPRDAPLFLPRARVPPRSTGPEEKTMQMEEIEQHATRLFNEIGPKAIATAAQRAHDAEEKGASDAAANWRRIEARLLEMRGPRQS